MFIERLNDLRILVQHQTEHTGDRGRELLAGCNKRSGQVVTEVKNHVFDEKYYRDNTE
jgi:hypothetical protein